MCMITPPDFVAELCVLHTSATAVLNWPRTSGYRISGSCISFRLPKQLAIITPNTEAVSPSVVLNKTLRHCAAADLGSPIGAVGARSSICQNYRKPSALYRRSLDSAAPAAGRVCRKGNGLR